MNELDDWVAAASEELGLRPDDVQPKVVLDVAREVAHQVLRPAAPLTAYLMGVAVGRGADPADTAARISALALAWPGHDHPEGQTGPVREIPEGSAGPADDGPEGSAGPGHDGPEGSVKLDRKNPERSAGPDRETPDTVADPPPQ